MDAVRTSCTINIHCLIQEGEYHSAMFHKGHVQVVTSDFSTSEIYLCGIAAIASLLFVTRDGIVSPQTINQSVQICLLVALRWRLVDGLSGEEC